MPGCYPVRDVTACATRESARDALLSPSRYIALPLRITRGLTHGIRTDLGQATLIRSATKLHSRATARVPV